MAMISLRNDDIAVDIDPARGGGILRFDWRNTAIFLPARADDLSPFGLANFVMIPFSNRIANGRFFFEKKLIVMAPNNPSASTHHAIHGHGYLTGWDVASQNSERAQLSYSHKADSWPWDYRCDQDIRLLSQGYVHKLTITNLSDSNMPAGCGFHPYFPKENARLLNNFDGYWDGSPDGLPTRWIARNGPFPLAEQSPVDTIFTGRNCALTIDWPTHELCIETDADLPLTHIFTPPETDFFCIEPVSHLTDAVNRGGLKTLEPGESWTTEIACSVVEK
ncbi:MAG: aldose 1-epimerase [Parasphingorhabdus sp.]|uniref:aldose 1-epimerase n=1 Tax=Parasphingorhabdus sp. TaxID=2709688 RepID=UPI003296E07E